MTENDEISALEYEPEFIWDIDPLAIIIEGEIFTMLELEEHLTWERREYNKVKKLCGNKSHVEWLRAVAEDTEETLQDYRREALRERLFLARESRSKRCDRKRRGYAK